MNRFLRICRTMHSWLGAVIMPLVLIIGATGFYLNHEKLVLGLIGYSELSESDLSGAQARNIDEKIVSQIVATIWPDQAVQKSGFADYRGVRNLVVQKQSGSIIFPGPQSNHYFIRTTLTEKTYDMEGNLLHSQYNLKSILKSLHERGWVGTQFGTFLADIVALAMIFFSISGITLWSVPKIRRLRSHQRRAAAA